MNDYERELDWNDSIEHDSEFVILPEGDYDFEVMSFERARHAGSEKLPACNKAILTLKVYDNKGNETEIKHNLFLHTKTEGMLCAFFVGIGQRKHGEQLKMNWNTVVGSKGRAKIAIKKWEYDGKEYEGNEVRKFYEPEQKFTPGTF